MPLFVHGEIHSAQCRRCHDAPAKSACGDARTHGCRGTSRNSQGRVESDGRRSAVPSKTGSQAEKKLEGPPPKGPLRAKKAREMGTHSRTSYWTRGRKNCRDRLGTASFATIRDTSDCEVRSAAG